MMGDPGPEFFEKGRSCETSAVIMRSQESQGGLPQEREKDYKALYQQEFDRRTTLMKLAQKATRDYDELKHRYTEATQTVEVLRIHLEKKDHELNSLQDASEAVYHEYQSLKTRYEVESETMAQAFSRASEWYKENQSLRREAATLKRQSTLLLQKVSDIHPEGGDLKTLAELDEVSNHSDKIYKEQQQQHEKEINKLMEKIKALEGELASANSELNKVRQDEFDAQEELVEVRKQLDFDQNEIKELQNRVEELEGTERRLQQVSSLVIKEVEALQIKLSSEETRAEEALSIAAKAKRQHASLARQSAVVLSEAANDVRVRNALEEVHRMTSQFLKQQEVHNATVQILKDKISAYENQECMEELLMLREKVTLLEEEILEYRKKNLHLKDELTLLQTTAATLHQELYNITKIQTSSTTIEKSRFPVHNSSNGSLNSSSILMSSPPPPPPPPPPPLPSSGDSVVSTLASIIGLSKKNKATSPEVSTDNKAAGMDDLIDQIKRGGIQLKQTGGNSFLLKGSHRETKPETPKSKHGKPTNAVQEMKSILANMKRSRSGRVKPSVISQESKEMATKKLVIEESEQEMNEEVVANGEKSFEAEKKQEMDADGIPNKDNHERNIEKSFKAEKKQEMDEDGIPNKDNHERNIEKSFEAEKKQEMDADGIPNIDNHERNIEKSLESENKSEMNNIKCLVDEDKKDNFKNMTSAVGESGTKEKEYVVKLENNGFSSIASSDSGCVDYFEQEYRKMNIIQQSGFSGFDENPDNIGNMDSENQKSEEKCRNSPKTRKSKVIKIQFEDSSDNDESENKSDGGQLEPSKIFSLEDVL